MKSGKHGYSLRVMTGSALLGLALVAVVWASQLVPGVTAFLELDENVGYDGGFVCSISGGSCLVNGDCPLGQTCNAGFDWANSGANPSGCPDVGGTISCGGTGGIFDGGKFNGSTTPPTPPTETAAALADPHIVAASFGVDPLSVDVTGCGVGDPTVYTATGGETNGDDLNTETFSTGSVPNKDEISNVYAINHQVPPSPAVPSNTDTNEVFAAFERVVNNGDSHVDLEFLQQAVTLVPGSKPAQFPCVGKFKGDRTQGDLLLSVDFTQGGGVGNPALHKWDCGNVIPPPSGICNPTKSKGGPHYVETVLPPGVVIQKFNGTGPVGCGGWVCRNADGTETSTINTVEFYEVGIDLAAVGFTGCISTFLPHTRSSQSFTATLKDFEIIQFNTCVPSTNLTKTASKTQITAGDSVTYTYVETNDGNLPLKPPGASNPPVPADRSKLVTDDKCSPVTFVSGDTNSNNILDPGESWTLTCTLNNIQANTTNTATGHGIDLKGRDVTHCPEVNGTPTPPDANTFCDQDEQAAATVTVKTPSTILTKCGSASVVTTVAYTYKEKNDGEVPLTNPFVVDTQCTTHGGTISQVLQGGGDPHPGANVGDLNGNGVLDPLETWRFTCTATFNTTGTFTNVAVGHGTDNLGRDVTVATCPNSDATHFCDPDETDTNTVTVSVTGPDVCQ